MDIKICEIHKMFYSDRSSRFLRCTRKQGMINISTGDKCGRYGAY